MIAIFLVTGLVLLGLAFAFRQSVLAFVAGFSFIGLIVSGWNSRVETYDVYGLLAILGLVLLLVSFICGFLVQHQRARENDIETRRLNKEFPIEPELTEEEAYSKLLDGEIGESAEEGATRKAKAVRKKYRAMMDR